MDALRLNRAFDGLSTDITGFINHYKRVRAERNALLAACKAVLDPNVTQTDAMNKVRDAVRQAEEEA